MTTHYEKQANEFAEKYNVKLKLIADPKFGLHFIDDRQGRWRFKMRLSRNGKSYQFWFGQSIAEGKKEPTMYDVLSTITKYPPGSFIEMCYEFSMEPTKYAEKLYREVVKEYEKVYAMFEDVMDELRSIDEYDTV